MKDRLCAECGKHVLIGTAVTTNFGLFHEGCYDGSYGGSLQKHGAHLTSVSICLERPIIRPHGVGSL